MHVQSCNMGIIMVASLGCVLLHMKQWMFGWTRLALYLLHAGDSIMKVRVIACAGVPQEDMARLLQSAGITMVCCRNVDPGPIAFVICPQCMHGVKSVLAACSLLFFSTLGQKRHTC